MCFATQGVGLNGNDPGAGGYESSPGGDGIPFRPLENFLNECSLENLLAGFQLADELDAVEGWGIALETTLLKALWVSYVVLHEVLVKNK